VDARARRRSARDPQLDLAVLILVVNAGSTSLKLHLVDSNDETSLVRHFEDVDGGRIAAVAHRVVHGGERFLDPVVIDEDVRREIVELEAIAPLHNAPALKGIDAAERAFPNVPHIAVFDTAFHRTISDEAKTYAIPSRWREWGVRRYGFHGLSVEWCVERVDEFAARRIERLVVCHLGGGSSITAVRDGRSVDTTMGFSPLEGVPMTTRAGSVDPGALVYLVRERGVDPAALDHALNFDSGMKALAGGRGEMRELEERLSAGDPAASAAVGVYVHRVAAAVAAMAAAAGGVDAVAFTAGIGEGSAHVRREVCERLRFLGLEIDEACNAEETPDCDIATPSSRVRALVIRAREEIVAARAARALLASRSRT
jgi:acetate kinase